MAIFAPYQNRLLDPQEQYRRYVDEQRMWQQVSGVPLWLGADYANERRGETDSLVLLLL